MPLIVRFCTQLVASGIGICGWDGHCTAMMILLRYSIIGLVLSQRERNVGLSDVHVFLYSFSDTTANMFV